MFPDRIYLLPYYRSSRGEERGYIVVTGWGSPNLCAAPPASEPDASFGDLNRGEHGKDVTVADNAHICNSNYSFSQR